MPTTGLDPEAAAFLRRLERPGQPPYHLLPLDVQRQSTEKMTSAFGPPRPEVAMAEEGRMSRPAALGGSLGYRLYRPLHSDLVERLPALVWYHGGGWTVGSIAAYDTLCRQLANSSACAVVSVSYRLAPEHPFPAATDDALFAFDWIREHAPRLGIDAGRLAVGGDSAGGNLAAVTAIACRDRGAAMPRFQLLIYPSTDQRGSSASHRTYADGFLLTQASLLRFRDNYLPDPADHEDWRASPLLAPSLAGLPPALVLTASHDPLVDDCRRYATRMREAGVPVTYSEYPGQIHSFFVLGGAIRAANRAVEEAAAALARALF
ncbi:MAG: alpha/beta hydrolase [Rhodocyclaceae bacterium]|nr:alpha/beta hydrolase [Rhodocyclaceae bacterium]